MTMWMVRLLVDFSISWMISGWLVWCVGCGEVWWGSEVRTRLGYVRLRLLHNLGLLVGILIYHYLGLLVINL